MNERPLELHASATVADAVREFDPSLLPEPGGGVLVTDGRGIELAASAVLVAGSILRVARSARSAHDADG